MLLGNDFESHRARFRARSRARWISQCFAGERAARGVILERATGMPYERIRRRARVAAGGRGSRRAAARSARRHAGGALLLARDGARHAAHREPAGRRDGMTPGTRVLPAGWARRWRGPRASAPAPACSSSAASIGNVAVLSATDADGSAFWVVPETRLVIVNIAGAGGGSAPNCPRCCCGPSPPVGRDRQGSGRGPAGRCTQCAHGHESRHRHPTASSTAVNSRA